MGPRIGVRIGRVDRADEILRQARLFLIHVERLKRTSEDYSSKIKQNSTNHRGSVDNMID